MTNDLVEALKNGISRNVNATAITTTNVATTNSLPTSAQNLTDLAARVGNMLERGEREGWIEASKKEKRGATGAVKQQKEKLSELNSLLRGNKIQIRLTSISNNYASFNVQGSNRGAIKSFSIGYYDGDRLSDMTGNSTIIVATNRGKLGKFEPEDVNYGLWSNAFNDIRNIEFNTPHKGEQFLDSMLPSLGRALLETNNPLITGTSTVGTTTLSTETVSHDDPNYIFNIAIESSTEPIENNTSTELFDFASSKAEEKSTTEGIDHTMQKIRKSSKYVYPIAPTPLMRQIISAGAFDVTNETATWINRQTNKTGEVSVFNETSIGKAPTAIPSTPKEPTAGMPAATIASLATLGGLGFFIAAGAVAYCLWHREKRTTGYSVSDLPSSPEKQSFLLEGGSSAEETAPTRLPRAGSDESKPLSKLTNERKLM